MRHRAAFTFVEVLLALALLGIVAAVASGTLRVATTAEERADAARAAGFAADHLLGYLLADRPATNAWNDSAAWRIEQSDQTVDLGTNRLLWKLWTVRRPGDPGPGATFCTRER